MFGHLRSIQLRCYRDMTSSSRAALAFEGAFDVHVGLTRMRQSAIQESQEMGKLNQVRRM